MLKKVPVSFKDQFASDLNFDLCCLGSDEKSEEEPPMKKVREKKKRMGRPKKLADREKVMFFALI